jgi:tight adherence protein B
MSNGLKSGLSVPQAIGLVVQEMPDPVRQEFNLVLGENKLGVPLEEALNSMAKRMRADDVEMLVTSINILKETGGNLAESFDTIATTIRERIKVEKKIQVLTASGLYQGMFVMAMPPILGVVFYTTDPEFMSPLFTTALGWTLVTAVLALEVVAFFVIMRIIKINV